jgi:hypothetical protein
MSWIHNAIERVKKHYLETRMQEVAAKKWMDGKNAFEKGKKLFLDKRMQEALDCFDEANDEEMR